MTAPLHTSTRYTVKLLSLGYTRDNGSGCGSGTWQRWGLVPVHPDGRAVLHWRDGKPKHVGPRPSGVKAPLWLHRAAAFIGRVGPLRIHELADIATWYQEHRVGEYPIDRFEMLESL